VCCVCVCVCMCGVCVCACVDLLLGEWTDECVDW